MLFLVAKSLRLAEAFWSKRLFILTNLAIMPEWPFKLLMTTFLISNTIRFLCSFWLFWLLVAKPWQ